MASIHIVLAGFGRYRKRRKSLTAVLVMVFFLVFFFFTFFNRLDSNLKTYWVKMLLGGDYAVSISESYVDIMTPVNPDNYFLQDDFLDLNSNLTDLSLPRLRIGVMAESATREENFEHLFVLVGLDPDREKNLLGSIPVQNDGSYFTGNPNEIILPQAIANDLGVTVGETVILAAQTMDGFLDMDAVTVVGIQEVSATAFIFGAYIAYAPLDFVQNLIATDKVSEMVLKTGAASFFGNPVKGEFLFAPALDCFSASRAVSIAYLLLRWLIVIFLGVFAFGIIYQNVLMMNEERTGEIAVYLTYGASPSWIARIMYSELALYTLFCAAIGTVFGVIALGGLTLAGLYPVDSVTEIMMGGTQLVLWPDPISWVSSVSVLLILVLASAFFPVQQAVSNTVIIKMFKR